VIKSHVAPDLTLLLANETREQVNNNKRRMKEENQITPPKAREVKGSKEQAPPEIKRCVVVVECKTKRISCQGVGGDQVNK
jgi:hypothetical protein